MWLRNHIMCSTCDSSNKRMFTMWPIIWCLKVMATLMTILSMILWPHHNATAATSNCLWPIIEGIGINVVGGNHSRQLHIYLQHLNMQVPSYCKIYSYGTSLQWKVIISITQYQSKKNCLRVTQVRSYFVNTWNGQDVQRQHLIQNDFNSQVIQKWTVLFGSLLASPQHPMFYASIPLFILTFTFFSKRFHFLPCPHKPILI